MKKAVQVLGLCLLGFGIMSLVVRHDVPDEAYIALGKNYPQVTHFSDGEGTLIAPTWSLTAAHVAEYIQEQRDKGIDRKVQCHGKFYDIDSIILHPNYEFTQYAVRHDIALVKLKEPVSDVTPVSLYRLDDEVGKQVVLVGSGDQGTGLAGPTQRDKVTRAATNCIDSATSQWIVYDFDKPTAHDATPYEGVSGPGDSGGPALIEKDGVVYVAGVSSHQRGSEIYGQGRYGVTEYYARVSSYIPWIERYVKGAK